MLRQRSLADEVAVGIPREQKSGGLVDWWQVVALAPLGISVSLFDVNDWQVQTMTEPVSRFAEECRGMVVFWNTCVQGWSGRDGVSGSGHRWLTWRLPTSRVVTIRKRMAMCKIYVHSATQVKDAHAKERLCWRRERNK
jgi:hypothetical protein